MITVKNAWHEQGYTGHDHLLSDTELEPIIGLQFRSVAEAKQAARKLSTGTGRDPKPPIGIEVIFGDGTTRTF